MSAPKQGGLFEDLIEVLFAPSKVFDRSRSKTAFMYALVTAVIVAVILVATKNLLDPWFVAQGDLAIAQAAKKGTPMPDQAISAMRAFVAWGFIGTLTLATLIGPYINAVFLLVGTKVAGAKLSYSQAALISVLAGVPRMLAVPLMSAQAVILDGEKARGISDLSLGVARFFDPATMSPAVMAMLGNLDITRLWQIALIAIGVSVIGRVSKSAGWIAAFIVFALNFIAQTLPAAFA